MSLFNWFSGKRRERQTAGFDGAGIGDGLTASWASSPAATDRVAPSVGLSLEDRRLQRHARREQLYVAVRESMTRSGVLSASYKFKVLSLDQVGNEFLVMMDLSMAFEGVTGKLGAMEALIARVALARFGITVPTVYWRMDAATVDEPINSPAPAAGTASSAAKPLPAAVPLVIAAAEPVSPAPALTARPPVAGGRVAMRRHPLEADEVAAFRQALLSASSKTPLPSPSPSPSIEADGKVRSGRHSYALLTGFEDTELPEPANAPALSKTQYGELT